MTTTRFEGTSGELPIEQLRLDAFNPRLSESLQGESQQRLLIEIVEKYNAIDVARSIASHGYFPSEPLIVIEGGRRHVSCYRGESTTGSYENPR